MEREFLHSNMYSSENRLVREHLWFKLSSQILETSWMKEKGKYLLELSDIIETITDPGRYSQKFMEFKSERSLAALQNKGQPHCCRLFRDFKERERLTMSDRDTEKWKR